MNNQPFTIQADPALFWFSENHLEALNQLQLSVQLRKGIVVVTGDAGVGKTQLVRAFLNQSPENVVISFLSNSRMSINTGEILEIVCEDLGYKADFKNLEHQTKFNLLYKYLLENSFVDRKFIVVIDDVHILGEKLIKELSLLSDLETQTRKLLQLIFVGRRQFIKDLELPKFLELRKQIQIHIHLQPFDLEETKQYILHQLTLSTQDKEYHFTNNAIQKIYQYSNGIPKQINKLCSALILSQFTKNKKKISSKMVETVWHQQGGEFILNGRGQNGFLETDEFKSIFKYYNGWCTGTDFSNILKTERQRSDRSGNPLSYLLINMPFDSKNLREIPESRYYQFLKKLMILVSENTRDSDLKYIFDKFKIGILLLDTPLDGAKKFIEKISSRLIHDLERSRHIEEIILIQSISISSYPLNQVKKFNKIEGTPIVLKNLEFAEKSKYNYSHSNSDVNFVSNSQIQFNWEAVPVNDGALAISTVLLKDLFERTKEFTYYDLFKRVIDLIGSSVGILILSPAMLLISIFIKISSKGPILFKQKRVGFLGKQFTFIKFRTMRQNNNSEIHKNYVTKLIQGNNSEVNGGSNLNPVFKIQHDPRVTKIGKFLRKTSLDELPQLFNVLTGSMSLVGPRPPIPYEVEVYKNWHYRRILEVKPGITGLWQVYGRSKTTFDDMVRLDLKYVNNRAALLDIKIILKTFKLIFKDDGAF